MPDACASGLFLWPHDTQKADRMDPRSALYSVFLSYSILARRPQECISVFSQMPVT